jgi:hypothetical protein
MRASQSRRVGAWLLWEFIAAQAAVAAILGGLILFSQDILPAGLDLAICMAGSLTTLLLGLRLLARYRDQHRDRSSARSG